MDDTKLIHQELLSLLEIFDKFCREKGIHYSLHGGTLLGAIREKGFIPWDDDVDITLLRSDFNKMKQCIKEIEADGDIEFDEHNAQRPMLWRHKSNKTPVWLDLFVYDYISENTFARKIKLLGLTFFLGFTKTKSTLAISKKGVYRGWKYAVIYCLYAFGKLFSMKTKLRWMDWFAENCFLGSKKWIQRTNDQYAGLFLWVPKEVMDDFTDIEFEGRKFMISKFYEPVLISCYGTDYMTPKRPTKHEEQGHEMYRKTKI